MKYLMGDRVIVDLCGKLIFIYLGWECLDELDIEGNYWCN